MEVTKMENNTNNEVLNREQAKIVIGRALQGRLDLKCEWVRKVYIGEPSDAEVKHFATYVILSELRDQIEGKIKEIDKNRSLDVIDFDKDDKLCSELEVLELSEEIAVANYTEAYENFKGGNENE